MQNKRYDFEVDGANRNRLRTPQNSSIKCKEGGKKLVDFLCRKLFTFICFLKFEQNGCRRFCETFIELDIFCSIPIRQLHVCLTKIVYKIVFTFSN